MREHQPIDVTDFALSAKVSVWTEKTATCWNWVGSKNAEGYGIFKYQGGRYGAHRVAWAIANKEDPSGQLIDHICHNQGCVNPEHLRLASHKQNAENMLPIRAASGFRGVHSINKKWRAEVVHHGVMHRSRSFATPEQANQAAIEMRNEMYSHNVLDR